MIRAAVLAVVLAGLLSACSSELVDGPPVSDAEWRAYCVAADQAFWGMSVSDRRTVLGNRMRTRVTECYANGYL